MSTVNRPQAAVPLLRRLAETARPPESGERLRACQTFIEAGMRLLTNAQAVA